MTESFAWGNPSKGEIMTAKPYGDSYAYEVVIYAPNPLPCLLGDLEGDDYVANRGFGCPDPDTAWYEGALDLHPGAAEYFVVLENGVEIMRGGQG